MGVPKGRHLCHIDDGMYGAARHVACRPFRFLVRFVTFLTGAGKKWG